jgi:hypothetical protein
MPLFLVLLIIVYVESYDYVRIKFWELSASSNVSLQRVKYIVSVKFGMS